jgi:hypothetical protein
METNFYIGQEVVAILDHSQGDYKKGDEFVVRGIRKGCCFIDLDIGKLHNGYINCIYCNSLNPANGVMWYHSRAFAPKQQLSDTTYNEVMEWIKQGKPIEQLN